MPCEQHHLKLQFTGTRTRTLQIEVEVHKTVEQMAAAEVSRSQKEPKSKVEAFYIIKQDVK